MVEAADTLASLQATAISVAASMGSKKAGSALEKMQSNLIRQAKGK